MKNINNWLNNTHPELAKKKVLYLCMEMLLPELNEDGRNANFKGGLGILAGDTMEGYSNIGIASLAVIPIYHSRWIQNIENDRQNVSIKEVDYSKEPLKRVNDRDNNPLTVSITFEDEKYDIEVYSINRGGTPVYLLKNKKIFDILYTGNRKKRLRQEVAVGKAVPKLLRALNIRIDIIHLNEAHTVIAAYNLKEEKKYEKTPILFTTHTPVPEGMEKYPSDWFELLDIPEKYRDLFMKGPDSGLIDFTLAALKISSLTNGVSQEHADVTRKMFPEFKDKIIGITNGSSLYWQAEELRNALSPSGEQLWNIHTKYKDKALRNAEKRLNKYLNLKVKFNRNKPTVGLFRRIADYKQQYPIFKDIIKAVCGSRDKTFSTPLGELRGLDLQVFIGGIAHPDDVIRKEWIYKFIRWTKSSELKGKFAFLPGYGEELLKEGARGYDIWVSCPKKGMEACGSSDQRTALNANFNITTATGGPLEYIDEFDPDTFEGSGMFIEPYESITLYEKLKIISNILYETIEEKNNGYKKIMENIYEAGMSMKIDKMIKNYAENFYLPVAKIAE